MKIYPTTLTQLHAMSNRNNKHPQNHSNMEMTEILIEQKFRDYNHLYFHDELPLPQFGL